MDFLKTLNPKEKEQLLEKLGKQRKRRRHEDKKKKKVAKKELKAELSRQLEAKSEILAPKLEASNEIESDDVKPTTSAAPIEIVLPQRKDEGEKARILEAKKEFARKLAQIKYMMEESESDDSDSNDSDSSEEDSDYDTASDPPTTPPTNMAPPKPGMILVKKKRPAPVITQDDIKRKRIEELKSLETQMKIIRKKYTEKQKYEQEENRKRIHRKSETKQLTPKPVVNEDDLTSGLLDCIDSGPSSDWKPTSLISYDSDSD